MSQSNGTPAVQNFSADDIKKLKEIVDEGRIVMQEIEDMKEGLNSTIKTIAEEVGIKPAQLAKAIKICFKNSLSEEQAKMDEIVEIIEAVGRG